MEIVDFTRFYGSLSGSTAYSILTTHGMVRELCSRCTWPRKYGPTSVAGGFSTTSPMRIMALLGDILGDYLHTNRGKIEISQVFIEI